MPTNNLSSLYDPNGNLQWGTSAPVNAIGTDPSMGPSTTYNPLIHNPGYFGGSNPGNLQPQTPVPAGPAGALVRQPGTGIFQPPAPTTPTPTNPTNPFNRPNPTPGANVPKDGNPFGRPDGGGINLGSNPSLPANPFDRPNGGGINQPGVTPSPSLANPTSTARPNGGGINQPGGGTTPTLPNLGTNFLSRPNGGGGAPTINQQNKDAPAGTTPNISGPPVANGPTGRFGNVYDVNSLISSGQFDSLPAWLKSQYTKIGGGSEGGTETWTLSGGPSGSFKDASGRDVVQWGTTPEQASTNPTLTSSAIKDKSKMWYDPDLGWVTTPDNVIPNIDENNFKKMFPMFLAMVGGATFLNGGGLESLFGSGAEAPGGYLDVLGNGLEPGGASLTGPVVPAGTFDTLPEFVSPNNPIPEFSSVPNFGGPASSLFSGASKFLNNPLTRLAGSALPSLFNGGGGPGANRPGSGPGSGPGGGSLLDLITGGLGAYSDNKTIQDLRGMQNDLFTRGDFAGPYRGPWMDRLNDFLLDPEKALQDPTYKASRERKLGDLDRKLNAKGYNMSGNEMGELLKYGTELDYSHISEQENQLRQAAMMSRPDQMAAAAMHNLPLFGQAMANRNAGVGNLISRLFGGGSNNNPNWLNGLLRPGGDTNNPGGWEDHDPNTSPEIDPDNPYSDIPDDTGYDYTPPNWANDPADQDWWNWIL